jgi:hypothetical protein
MFGIDEGADAAALLGFGNDMEGERRLAGGFRAVDFDNTAARKAADAKRNIEAERTCGDRLDFDRLLVFAEPHDRALAEGALDLGEGGIKGFGLVHGVTFHKAEIRLAHGFNSFWHEGF